MPGAGYTRELVYNEESQLLGISHSGTLAYQYAYGADGNRRWSKDIPNDLWTWYLCGVACGAGEMVEETSDLTGSSWATSGQYLRAGGGCSSLLIHRKSMTDEEYHQWDILGAAGIITSSTSDVLKNSVYDLFSVSQFSSGQTQSNWDFTSSYYNAEGLIDGSNGTNGYLQTRGTSLLKIDRSLNIRGNGMAGGNNDQAWICQNTNITCIQAKQQRFALIICNIRVISWSNCNNCPNQRCLPWKINVFKYTEDGGDPTGAEGC